MNVILDEICLVDDEKKMGELRSKLMNRERRIREKRPRRWRGTLLFVCVCENILFVIVEKITFQISPRLEKKKIKTFFFSPSNRRSASIAYRFGFLCVCFFYFSCCFCFFFFCWSGDKRKKTKQSGTNPSRVCPVIPPQIVLV